MNQCNNKFLVIVILLYLNNQATEKISRLLFTNNYPCMQIQRDNKGPFQALILDQNSSLINSILPELKVKCNSNIVALIQKRLIMNQFC